MDRSLTGANASELTAVKCNPTLAATWASAVPVLPPVYSTSRSPGATSPRSSAPPMMASANRSL